MSCSDFNAPVGRPIKPPNCADSPNSQHRNARLKDGDDYTGGISQRGSKVRRCHQVGHDPTQFSPIFSIDVSAERTSAVGQPTNTAEAAVALLHQVVMAQQKQNQLLEQLVQATVTAQKQRATELQQWKDANPHLAKSCRRAAEMLSRVQADFLQSITDEIDDSEEGLLESDYMLSEFVDRIGPRLAHLNGVLQVLAQLGNGQPAQQQ